MSVAGFTTEKVSAEYGSHAEAPERHIGERRCQAPLDVCKTAEQCGEVGKLHGYATPIDGVLLCEPCRRWCLKKGTSPKKHVGVESAGRTTAYPLPHLRKHRKAARLSVRALAAKVECSSDHIKRLERDHEYACSARLAAKMARALNVEASALSGRPRGHGRGHGRA